MKKFIPIIVIFSLSYFAKADFTDQIQNIGLYHCDSTNVTAWHTQTPDDNSSSRVFNPALMEFISEQPVLTPRSGGGGCLYFDGNNDGLYLPNYSGYIGWPGNKKTFFADLSVKWIELPSTTDNRAALIAGNKWNVFLKDNGAGKGIIELLVYNTANNPTFLTSDITLDYDTWYDIHAQLSNGVLSVTINGTTKSTSMNGELNQDTSQMEIGQGIFADRYFKGYLDEIRYGAYQDYFGPEIDNSDLLPLYKPDSEVIMEGNSPDWLKTLIMAQFRVETVTYEGDFSNAVKILDHYAKMGVNGLWINPIYERTGDNGYNGFGPHTIDDKIAGTSDTDLAFERAKEFVNEAHARNLRIFFDIVIWGVDVDSPLVNQHPSWFHPYNSTIDGYFYKIDNTEWQEWFINQATNLVISTGADGFRCDTEPASTGYSLWEEVRLRCYSVGKKVGIISEQFSTRNGVYDFEQIGVGYTETSQWDTRRDSGNYFISNNIVDTVTSGTAIGIPETEQGRSRFYTYNLCNHDSHYPVSLGNIIRFGYQAVLSPFIPMWYIGEEWNCYPNVSAVLYCNQVNWAKMLDEPNARFFEKVKKLIRIRRQYPDIFNCYPENHRNSNICKIDVAGNNLQAYARYKDGKGILVIPNFNDSINSFSFVPPYSDMGMDSATIFKVKNLLTDEIISTNLNISSAINITISNQSLAVLIVEENDGSFIPFDDSWNNIVLLHCDITTEPWWKITPDDNSCGRDANEPILNMNNSIIEKDETTKPVFVSNSPKGGNSLRFDGINDSIYCNPGWPARDSVVCDFSIKWLGLPAPEVTYAATVQAAQWRGFLQESAGNPGKGYLTFLVGSDWVVSSALLDSNKWYDVNFNIFGNHAEITVNGIKNSANVTLVNGASIIKIGYDYFENNRFFNGELDEIRVNNYSRTNIIFDFEFRIFPLPVWKTLKIEN